MKWHVDIIFVVMKYAQNSEFLITGIFTLLTRRKTNRVKKKHFFFASIPRSIIRCIIKYLNYSNHQFPLRWNLLHNKLNSVSFTFLLIWHSIKELWRNVSQSNFLDKKHYKSEAKQYPDVILKNRAFQSPHKTQRHNVF